MAKFEVPDGWVVQGFRFALESTSEQAGWVRRQFGGRRYARHWAVRTLKSDIDGYRATGLETDKPSFLGMRARRNKAKHTECSMLTPARCGGPRSARRRSPTVSARR
jgi:putative transposase